MSMRVWTTDEFAYEGSTFLAHGQTVNPQPGHVPIWIGGNSRLSRRRVAQYADGWVPFPAPRRLAATAKTPPLESTEDLAPMLDELWKMVEEADRDPTQIDVSFVTSAGGSPAEDTFDADAYHEGLHELASLGVNWTGVNVPGDSLAHAIETLERYGSEVIKPS